MGRIKDPSEHALGWKVPTALLLAFLLHNVEEALSFGTYRERAQTLIRTLAFPHYLAPSVDTFLIALGAISLAAAVSMMWVMLHPTSRLAMMIVKGLAWIMLINVAVPHVPAAILLGGYAPGVITALLINLPIARIALVRLRRAELQ